MTVNELISTWTPEEREELKELIEECRQREQAIEKARVESVRGLMRIADNAIGQMAEEIIEVIRMNIKGRA